MYVWCMCKCIYKEDLLAWLVGCDLGRQTVAISDKVSPHNSKAGCDGYSWLSIHIGCWIILNSARDLSYYPFLMRKFSRFFF